MELVDHLEPLLRKVGGAVGAILLDRDGMAIANARYEPSPDPEALGAGYSLLLRELLASSRRLGLGRMRALLLELEGGTIILLPLKEGYSLLLLLKAGGDVGRGIFEARKAGFRLEKEL